MASPSLAQSRIDELATGSAFGGGPAIVSAPTANRAITSTPFVVPISITDVTGDGVSAFQFALYYDPAVIDPFGANAGCSTAGTISAAANLNPTCNVTTPGTLFVSVSGAVPPGGIVGGGTILNITFAIDPAAIVGNFSPLTFDFLTVFTEAPGILPSTPANGRITLTGGSTAGDVQIGGRVLDGSGRGVGKARLALIGGDGIPRYALTNGFGYYRFSDVSVNDTYLLTVMSKRFTFAPKTITPSDDLLDVDFIPEQ